jgi:regulation of enolase protein 1 (concanavalin A-like superfamily)
MMRDGSNSGAINALVALTPGSGFVFQSRSTVGGATTQGGTAASNAAPNNWVRLTRSGTLITAYVSADGTSWTQVGTAVLNMSSSISVGLAVTSGSNMALGTATFDNVSVTPFPAPWQTVGIGTTALQGSAEYYNSTSTIKGAGTLSGTSDSFRFLYQMLTGNGEIKARILNTGSAGANTRVGVMIRETLTGGSAYAFMGIDGNKVSTSQCRSNSGGATAITNGGPCAAGGIWVRLVRTGSSLTSYASVDGVTWTKVDHRAISMAKNIYIGFADASGSTATLNTTTFDNVTVVPWELGVEQ